MRITTIYNKKQNYAQLLFNWARMITRHKTDWFIYTTLKKPYDWEKC